MNAIVRKHTFLIVAGVCWSFVAAADRGRAQVDKPAGQKVPAVQQKPNVGVQPPKQPPLPQLPQPKVGGGVVQPQPGILPKPQQPKAPMQQAQRQPAQQPKGGVVNAGARAGGMLIQQGGHGLGQDVSNLVHQGLKGKDLAAAIKQMHQAKGPGGGGQGGGAAGGQAAKGGGGQAGQAGGVMAGKGGQAGGGKAVGGGQAAKALAGAQIGGLALKENKGPGGGNQPGGMAGKGGRQPGGPGGQGGGMAGKGKWGAGHGGPGGQGMGKVGGGQMAGKGKQAGPIVGGGQAPRQGPAIQAAGRGAGANIGGRFRGPMNARPGGGGKKK